MYVAAFRGRGRARAQEAQAWPGTRAIPGPLGSRGEVLVVEARAHERVLGGQGLEQLRQGLVIERRQVRGAVVGDRKSRRFDPLEVGAYDADRLPPQRLGREAPSNSGQCRCPRGSRPLHRSRSAFAGRTGRASRGSHRGCGRRAGGRSRGRGKPPSAAASRPSWRAPLQARSIAAPGARSYLWPSRTPAAVRQVGRSDLE